MRSQECPVISSSSLRAFRVDSPRREASVFGLIFVFSAILAIGSPAFRTPGNLLALAREIAVIGIMACGEAMTLIIGGLDLSVASMLVLSAGGTALALMAGWPLPAALLLGLAIGLAAGLANGLLISVLNLPPIVVTLATYGVYRAIVTLVTHSQEIGPLPSSFAILGLGLSPALILLATAVASSLFLSRSALGRRLYALGGNEEACRVSGLSPTRLKPVAYAISGVCATLAGFIVAGSSGGLQNKAALGYELDVIAACVIGGVSLQGGQGSVIGAVAGAVFLRLINNALLLFNVPVDWYRMVIALALLIAAVGDRIGRLRSGNLL
jgi:ribose transport system permease protein